MGFYEKKFKVCPECQREMDYYEKTCMLCGHEFSETRAVIGTEAYLLYHDRTKNGEVPAGVGILEQRHFDLWGENMVPVSEVKWLNEDFCVIELKEENKEIAPDCEITYLVWGVFKKTVVGNSKED